MLSELFKVEKVLDVCSKICYFLVVNLLFIISNIPVLLFLLFVGISQVRTYLPLFLLSMVPMAPALSAVMYCMNRIINGIETGAWRDYKKGYRSSLWQKIKLALGHVLVILIFWTNIEFFTFQMPLLPLAAIFIFLFAVSILVTPELYLLASRYEMSNLELAKTALTLTLGKPITTLGNVAALGIVLASFELVAGTTVLFMGSVYCFLVVFMNQRILNELESRE